MDNRSGAQWAGLQEIIRSDSCDILLRVLPDVDARILDMQPYSEQDPLLVEICRRSPILPPLTDPSDFGSEFLPTPGELPIVDQS